MGGCLDFRLVEAHQQVVEQRAYLGRGLGFGVWGVRFGGWGLEFREWGLGIGI